MQSYELSEVLPQPRALSCCDGDSLMMSLPADTEP